MIPIPFIPKAQAVNTQIMIEDASALTGLDEHTLLIAMSGLSEATANLVAHGKSVRWPAFGIYSPLLVTQMRRGATSKHPHCKPAFAPTKSFRQQVALGAPPCDDGNKDFARYNKNHVRSLANDDGSRAFTAHASFRQQVEAQLAHSRDA